MEIFTFVFQASKDVSNFFASFALAEVTTTINMLALVCHETGLTMNATVSCQINFNIILIIMIFRMPNTQKRTTLTWWIRCLTVLTCFPSGPKVSFGLVT